MSLVHAPENFEIPGSNKIPFGNYVGLVRNHEVASWEDSFTRRRFQRKSWIFGGSFTPQASVGFAIADIGYAANAFCYFYGRHDNHAPVLFDEEATLPFYFPRNFKPSLLESWTLKSGRRKWTVQARPEGWELTFHGRHLSMSLVLEHSFQGISAVSPVEGRPFHYTYKLASVPAQVKVALDGITHQWSGNCGAFDFSVGFPPRRTFWNWGSLVGKTSEGLPIGVNIADPFNQGLENALWFDKKLIPLSSVSFEYKRPALANPWYIKSRDGRLSVEFYPEAEHKKKKNLLVLKSHFQQAVGHFKGVWKDLGREIEFSGSGVVEEHTALW